MGVTSNPASGNQENSYCLQTSSLLRFPDKVCLPEVGRGRVPFEPCPGYARGNPNSCVTEGWVSLGISCRNEGRFDDYFLEHHDDFLSPTYYFKPRLRVRGATEGPKGWGVLFEENAKETRFVECRCSFLGVASEHDRPSQHHNQRTDEMREQDGLSISEAGPRDQRRRHFSLRE